MFVTWLTGGLAKLLRLTGKTKGRKICLVFCNIVYSYVGLHKEYIKVSCYNNSKSFKLFIKNHCILPSHKFERPVGSKEFSV